MNKMLLLTFVIVSVSCGSTDTSAHDPAKEMQYASTFHFEEKDGKRWLVVDKPWPNARQAKRYKLDKPLERVVCTSTTHLPYFEMLGKTDAVIGFPNVNYISSPAFVKRAKNGDIQDLGPDGNLNLELLLSLQPDAVIAFDMGGESAMLDKIEEAGIPVIYNADFLETSPLGRAEWIRFFGALLGEDQAADSIFRVIASDYERLSRLAKKSKEKPKVLSGVVYGDTWFLPGGKNWSSVFYENAGGEYVYANDSTTGWMELSFEAVFDRAADAPYWIGTSTFDTKAALLAADARYAGFEAFQSDRVYNYSKRKGPQGGYDFLESGYARPDLVLGDLIKILHPELLPDYETVYFEPLQ